MPVAAKRAKRPTHRRPAGYARGPYSSYSLDDLICANAARPDPLPLTDLPRYAGHTYSSIPVRHAACKRSGRLTREGNFDPAHPLNATLAPLPDLPPGWVLPTPSPTQAAHASAAAVASIVGQPLANKQLSHSQIVQILDSYIINGGSGRDILTAIKTRLDMADLSHGSGPPPPATDAAVVDRLLALLRELPTPLVRQAFALWEPTSEVQLPLLPPQASPSTPGAPPPPGSPPGLPPPA